MFFYVFSDNGNKRKRRAAPSGTFQLDGYVTNGRSRKPTAPAIVKLIVDQQISINIDANVIVGEGKGSGLTEPG